MRRQDNTEPPDHVMDSESFFLFTWIYAELKDESDVRPFLSADVTGNNDNIKTPPLPHGPAGDSKTVLPRLTALPISLVSNVEIYRRQDQCVAALHSALFLNAHRSRFFTGCYCPGGVCPSGTATSWSSIIWQVAATDSPPRPLKDTASPSAFPWQASMASGGGPCIPPRPPPPC